ncbi:MAG TPA: hypothetical protein VFM06_06830, partial [Candidatus Limnocylindria bacterium]|nr:hypothetical protein [Candidatus Limnocylindria bacterium]
AGNVVTWDGVRTSLAGTNVNEVRSVSVNVAGPSAPGTYTLRYDIVQEGVTWFSGRGMQTPTRSVSVVVGGYAAVYAPGTASVNGTPGSTITVPVTITNVGTLVWQPGSVNVSYHLIAASGAVFVWDGQRTAIPTALGRGQSVTVNVKILLPSIPSTYVARIEMVQEGVTWFSGHAIAPGSVTLLVQ